MTAEDEKYINGLEQRVEALEGAMHEAVRVINEITLGSYILEFKTEREKQSPIDRAVDHIFTEVLLFANSESSEESCKKTIRTIIERVVTESSACDRTR